MASDLRIQGEVVVNSEQAESAFDRVGDKAQQMANEVSTSAGKAGQAVDKIGDGAGASAEKFTRAESRMSAAIKKATTELELLGKTASQRLEFNIADKGLDASKFEPALQKLREVEAQAQAAQRAATGSLDKMGISAAQTAAALRGVPAQFTDIVTSLQGGQAPLTVFLQQGGQLKDMFGGAGNAARALGGYVLGLVNPFTLAAAAVAALAVAYNQGSKEADSYARSIALSGNAAGTTAAQLQQMAARISDSVGTQGAAAEALAQLAGTGKVAKENLEGFAETAVRLDRVGIAVKDTVKEFAELGKAPVEASKRLNESYNYLTAAVFEQIKALQEQGRTLDAAALAQKAYDQAMSNVAATLEGRLGYVERAWKGVGDAAKWAWDKMLNVGRPDTLASQLETARARLEEKLSTPLAVDNPAMRASREKGIEALRNEINLLTEQERVMKRGAEAQAQRAQAEKDAIAAAEALQKTQDKGLSKQQQMNKALEDYRRQLSDLRATNPGSALLSDSAVARGEAAIREQFKDKGAAASIKKEESAYASLVAAINEKINANEQELMLSGGLNDADKLRIKLLAELASGAKTITDAHKADALALLSKLDAQEREKGLIKSNVAAYREMAATQEEIAQAYVAESKAREAGRAAVSGYVNGIQESADALRFEVSLMGLSEQARKTAIAQYRIELELKKQIEAIDKNAGFDEAQREEERARARAAAATAAANAGTRVMLDEWQKTTETINQSLTDALLRGFESGKDFAKNFRDTLVNMFKTLVLRPIISAVVNPVAGAITGALGLAGTANAGTSALGTVGNIASGARLLGGLGAFGGGLSGGFGGLMGSLGLSATGTTLGGALSAGSIALQSGNILGGLGTFAGALGPIALGIGALTSLLGSFKGETRTGGQFGVAFDGAVTNNRRGETYTYEGQQFDRDFSNGRRDALTNGQAYRLEGDPVAQESAIRDAVAGTATGINAFLEALGSSARLTGFSAGLETSGKGRGGVFAGGMLSNGQGFGESGKGDNYDGTLYEAFSTNSPDFKTALENFTLDLKQSTIQALQSVTDIPDAIKQQLEGVDAESLTAEAADSLLTAINAQIVGVEQFRGALEAMGLEQFAGMAFDTAAAIAEAAGGFEALQTSVTGYYENYYSEAEKTALQTKMVKDALAEVGLEMPKTREEFRAMVEASLALGESGAEATAALLGVQDEFAAIAPQVQTLSDAFSVSGDTIKGILDDALANASSAAEASQMASDAFVDAMYSSINDAMTSNLSGLIMGAIQPMVDALIAGATTSGAAMAAGGAAGGGAVAAGGAAGGGAVAAGGATAGAVMAGVVEQARASISAWASVLSDPQIQASIQEIGNLVGGVAGVAYEVTGGAFNGGGSKWESPGSPSAPGGGADAYNDALKSIGDTIEDEVKRLRGLMVEDSPFSKESLLAQFTTATAQARAGDKDALAKLPDLSKAIEAASAVTAVSAVEMARTRGWLAGSLEETLKALGLTGAGGVTPVITAPTPTTPTTPTTPQVIKPVYNPAISGATMDPALLAEVKALRQDLASLKTNDDQNHEEAQSMRLRVARSVERLESATVLQS